MTLGEIIKQYAKEHSMNDFLEDSGLSRTYTYMLIRNQNKNGLPITPSLETIKKVAKGIHSSVDNVISLLDEDYVIHIGNYSSIPEELMKLYRSLPLDAKENVHQAIRNEYEKNKEKINEYNRIKHMDGIKNVDDALRYLDYFASFEDMDCFIETVNKIKMGSTE